MFQALPVTSLRHCMGAGMPGGSHTACLGFFWPFPPILVIKLDLILGKREAYNRAPTMVHVPKCSPLQGALPKVVEFICLQRVESFFAQCVFQNAQNWTGNSNVTEKHGKWF